MGPRHRKLGARISIVKHLLAITITLLPSAVLAEQFTPQQMLEVMTKSPSNRDVRAHDLAAPSEDPGGVNVGTMGTMGTMGRFNR